MRTVVASVAGGTKGVRWAYFVGTEYELVSNRTSDNESAATQIKDQGRPGIIALELALRRNPTNRTVTPSI